MKAPRDPAALARVGGLLLATVVLWPLAVIGEFRPWVLFEAQNLRVMGGFLGGFLPPASGGRGCRLQLTTKSRWLNARPAARVAICTGAGPALPLAS